MKDDDATVDPMKRRKIETDDPRPDRRIRVRVDFEIEGPGLETFPDWLFQIVPEGLMALQDDKVAPDPMKYWGGRFNFSQVDEATLKRRKTRADKGGGKR